MKHQALTLLLAAALLPACTTSGSDGGSDGNVLVTIRIENIGTTFTEPSGEVTPVFAPGIWVLHQGGEPLFTAQMPDRGEGLEALAEDGDPASLSMAAFEDLARGTFTMPDGTYEDGAIEPGGSFSAELSVPPGARLSLAGMFVQSNDLFVGTPAAGIPLVDMDGALVATDLTASFDLWDAGTEVNEEPGFGPNQAPRQAGPNTGPDEGGVVRPVSDAGDGFNYPAVSDFLRITATLATDG